MLVEIRIDKSQLLVVDTRYENTDAGAPSARSELVAATLLDTKLSDAEKDHVLTVLADIVDYFSVSAASVAPPDGDWYDDFLAATRGSANGS